MRTDVMRIASALFLVAVAVPLSAQGAPASLPIPLVTALFSGVQPVGRGSMYVVGDPPAGWPMELWPPGSAAVGGMSDGRMLVAVFADTARRPLASYLTLLQKAGFSQPTQQGSGFMSSGGPFSWYCRDSSTVSARTAPSPTGVTYLRVTYTPGSRSSCSLQERPTPRRPEMLELPELPPPPGLRASGAGSSASSSGLASEGRLTGTSVTPAEVLAHYARLLSAAGWTAGKAVADSGAGVQLFRAHDAKGRPWQGTLSVFATPTGRNVNLDMHAEDAR